MTRVAAVDVGTNSVRLLVADAGEPLTTVERLMRVTRLGAGVDASGRLDDAALARTLDCIADYAQRWTALGARRVRVAATSAVRDATDRDRFFAGVRERAGVDAEVLTAGDEAAHAFAGATATVDAPGPYLVVDIGGGSTEFVLGDEGPTGMVSRQLGCVRLTERWLPSDPPTRAELGAARAVVADHLDEVAAALPAGSAATLIGVAGTVTTLGALHLGLDVYRPEHIHGVRMPADAVETLVEWLATMPSAAIAELGPMAPGREDVITGGGVILAEILRRFGFPEVAVSEADGLDGLALSLLAGPARDAAADRQQDP